MYCPAFLKIKSLLSAVVYIFCTLIKIRTFSLKRLLRLSYGKAGQLGMGLGTPWAQNLGLELFKLTLS